MDRIRLGSKRARKLQKGLAWSYTDLKPEIRKEFSFVLGADEDEPEQHELKEVPEWEEGMDYAVLYSDLQRALGRPSMIICRNKRDVMMANSRAELWKVPVVTLGTEKGDRAYEQCKAVALWIPVFPGLFDGKSTMLTVRKPWSVAFIHDAHGGPDGITRRFGPTLCPSLDRDFERRARAIDELTRPVGIYYGTVRPKHRAKFVAEVDGYFSLISSGQPQWNTTRPQRKLGVAAVTGGMGVYSLDSAVIYSRNEFAEVDRALSINLIERELHAAFD